MLIQPDPDDKEQSMEIIGFRRRPAVWAVTTLVSAVALGSFSMAAAETIYKSVDAEGRVTYSSEPPEKAVETQTMTLPKAPSETDQQEAIEREQELKKAADKVTSERAAETSQRRQAASSAERALVHEQRRLEEAKVMRDSDDKTMYFPTDHIGIRSICKLIRNLLQDSLLGQDSVQLNLVANSLSFDQNRST